MNNPTGYTGGNFEAFELGYNELGGYPVPPERLDIREYKRSARYKYEILPKLRAMAGATDDAMGTWGELAGGAPNQAPYLMKRYVDIFVSGIRQKNQDMIDEGREIIDVPPVYGY